MAAVRELVDRLGMIKLLDVAIGRIKTRGRGPTGGQLLVGLVSAQLAGETFGSDRIINAPMWLVRCSRRSVAGLSSTTAAGLARRLTVGQWRAVETGIGDIHTAMLSVLPPARAAAVCDEVNVDFDTTDVEVETGGGFQLSGATLRVSARGQLGADRDGAGADLMAGDAIPGLMPLSC